MNDAVTYVWAFGGPLADAPPEAAWTILAATVGVCALFAWVSYRHAVTKLGVMKSFTLMLLRTLFLSALLFCLANPVRIERKSSQPPEPPPPPPPARLAVIVDRSDSMTVPDNRGRSRLDAALVNWRRLEKTAQTFFASPQYYSFAADLRPAATLEEALARKGDTGETRLYRSVAALLKKPPGERPDTVVVLTDGVDTTADSEAMLRESALAAGVPVYFVAGTNRSERPDPFLRVREWRGPNTVMRNTEFALEATFEAFSRADRTEKYSLWQGNRRVAGGSLALTTGSNLIPRSFPVSAGEPGVLEFTLRLGESADSPPVARSITRVLEPRAKLVRVLVYQGALDWGFRYLSDALRTDPSFTFVTLVTPDSGLTLVSGPPGSASLGRLPEDVKALNAFDCVVLAHLYPQRLSIAQQQALVDFTRAGGSVLILSPDAEAIPQFSAGPLQEILPVNFSAAVANEMSKPEVQPSIRRRGKTVNDAREPVSLEAFSLTELGRDSPIFARADGAGGGLLAPRFLDFAPVARAKPGAEVLAVHPSSRDPVTGQPHILLAMETFGRGRSALLTTDGLWRWKLSERSDSRVVETFWQQLLLAISRRSEPEGLRFTNAPAQVRVGQTVTLFLGGASADQRPVVIAKSPAGKLVSLEAKPAPDADAPWSIDWSPEQAGGWEISAGVEGAHRAHIFPSVVAEVMGEMARTAPALEPLRTLAGETGGALLAHEPPAAWRPDARKEKPPETVVSERQYLRWNNWNLLWLALGLYAVELVLRRLCKLL